MFDETNKLKGLLDKHDELIKHTKPGTFVKSPIDEKLAFVQFLDGMLMNANLQSDVDTISIIKERFIRGC